MKGGTGTRDGVAAQSQCSTERIFNEGGADCPRNSARIKELETQAVSKNLVPIGAWGTSDNAEFRIRLPEDADSAQPSAESKFGLLTVTVPLVVPEAPRQVEVKVAA